MKKLRHYFSKKGIAKLKNSNLTKNLTVCSNYVEYFSFADVIEDCNIVEYAFLNDHERVEKFLKSRTEIVCCQPDCIIFKHFRGDL